MKKIKVALDTSAIITKLISNNPTYLKDLLLLMDHHPDKFELYTCQTIYDEILATLNKPKIQKILANKIEAVRQFLEWYNNVHIFLEVDNITTVSIDNDNNIFFSISYAVQADYLISLDRVHILSLKSKIKKPKILTPREAFELLYRLQI